MLPRGLKSRFLLIAAALAGLSACGSDDDIFVRPLTQGDTFALTSANRLISFNRTQPTLRRTSVDITGLATGESVVGIDIRPSDNMVYGLVNGGAAARVVTINPSTGAVTAVVTLAAAAGDDNPYTALDGANFGVDFNPVPNALRVVSDTGQNLRINLTTGAAITDGTLTLAGATATGITGAAYTNSFNAACRTTLYYLDTSGNRLLTTSAPNLGLLTTVGSLGVTAAGGVSAFEIVTSAAGANAAFVAVSGASGSALYTFDPAMINTTAALTAVGPISTVAGETVRGLAIAAPATAPAQALGAFVGATTDARLVSFNQGAQAKLCTNQPITGLGTGETLLGIDFRPANGMLYGLTSDAAGTGRLYTINTATNVATLVSTLSADPADASPIPNNAPYMTLSGTAFGVDFNPVPDRLRVISDTGQNLRINVDSGATITDGNLNGAATGATAAAYTNSVAGAGTTTLYSIDASTATDTLYIQNPPNNGTLGSGLPLGVDFTAINAFDIDGRDNTALLAGSVSPATVSSLYAVNLATGAATVEAGGAIGSGTTPALTTQLVGLSRVTPTTTVFGLRNGNELVRLNSLTDPTSITVVGTVTGLTTDTSLIGIDFRSLDGQLYGVGNAGGLYRLDPATGAVVAGSRVGLSTVPDVAATAYGVDFNPAPTTVPLRIVSDTEQNLRVTDFVTGATTPDTALTRTAETFSISAAAYSNSVPTSGGATALYGLDAVGNRLVAISPPNNGVVRVIGLVGAGLDVTTNSAFEIIGPPTATSPGLAIAIFDTTPADKVVYSIDLTTGAATQIGVTDGPLDGFLGLAAPITNSAPAVDSLLYAYDEGDNLVAFPRNAIDNRVLDANVTGFVGGAGEGVVGIDFRTADSASNLLWLLTNEPGVAARLYTVNLTGVTSATTALTATLASTLTATGATGCLMGAPAFTGLSGTTFAVDFNPSPAAVPLRIISDTGQNLRVTAPGTGATCVDASIGQPAPNVNGAAYTNSFRNPPGVTGTTALFVLDAATGQLMQQGLTAPPGPNGGVLTAVGALRAGDNFNSVSGFDIAGGANGIALAAMQRLVGNPAAAETASRLYRINLVTGAATEVGADSQIGGAAGPALNGLAIRIQ